MCVCVCGVGVVCRHAYTQRPSIGTLVQSNLFTATPLVPLQHAAITKLLLKPVHSVQRPVKQFPTCVPMAEDRGTLYQVTLRRCLTVRVNFQQNSFPIPVTMSIQRQHFGVITPHDRACMVRQQHSEETQQTIYSYQAR